MLSSLSKCIYQSRLPLSVIKRQHLFASSSSSSKRDSTSPSTGDTHENGKKDIHDPKIDSSHQSGTKNQKERTALENAEQGFTSNIETRQERLSPEEKARYNKTSNK